MTTNNHPAHGPVSLDRLHQISEILSKAAAQSDGGNLGYAMADAVKVINGVIASRSAEPVFFIEVEGDDWIQAGRIPGSTFDFNNLPDGINKLYATPQPAPDSEAQATLKRLAVILHGSETDLNLLMVTAQSLMDRCRADGAPAPVVPEALLSAMEEVLRISDRDHEAWNKAKIGIASCRAAMLQDGNSPVLSPIDHGYRPECECSGCKATSRICAELAGNSPVTPDGWIPVSERMPDQYVEVIVCTDAGSRYIAAINRQMSWDDGDFSDDIQDVTHWMPLPAPPQQEVTSARVHPARNK